MYFGNLWGLLALLSLPAIAVIHLYHRRFPRLEIAGLHLWGVEPEVRTAGRRRDRLPITATLLLELLAALLLSLVLSEPRWRDSPSVEHLVVVLDNSASMSASFREGRTIRDEAIASLTSRAEDLPRGSVFSLIATGRRPTMLAGPAANWETAKSALAAWNPSAPHHEFQGAWDLAAQLADNSGQLVFITDRIPGNDQPVPQRMELVSIGRALENIAITAARWTFESSSAKGHVFLRVKQFGLRRVDAQLTGRTSQGVVFQQKISLEPGAETSFEADVPGGLGEMTVNVAAENDALAVDSSITLIEPKVRTVTVAVTLPPEDAATRVIEKVITGIPDVQKGDSANAHLIVGPAHELPASRSNLWWLGVGPLLRTEEARKNARDLLGPFLLEKKSPLLEGVVLGGVIWGGTQNLNLNATPLISAGKVPLFVKLNGTDSTAYVLNIDLARPNLSESPDWPILIKNLFDQRRENLPGLRQWNYRLNEDIRFRLTDGNDATSIGEGELTLLHGEHSRPLARSNPVEIPPLDETGVFEVRDGEKSIGRFAVNFHDPQESSLVDLAPGVRAPTSTEEPVRYSVDNPYSWLMMGAIALILVVVFLDWLVLKPGKVAAR